MAEAFLNQLPCVGRGILGEEDQRCSICMEDYGTTQSATGIIERAVKLPCNHIMGSECISIWVSSPTKGGSGNNTCPICRRVLFQVSPPPMSPARAEHMRIHTVLVNRCASLSAQLGLNPKPEINRMARSIANLFHDRVGLEGPENEIHDDRPVHAIAAASVYMASHLLGDARSLQMISSCLDVQEGIVGRAYVVLYGHRFDIIDTQLLAQAGMGLGAIDEALPSVMSY